MLLQLARLVSRVSVHRLATLRLTHSVLDKRRGDRRTVRVEGDVSPIRIPGRGARPGHPGGIAPAIGRCQTISTIGASATARQDEPKLSVKTSS